MPLRGKTKKEEVNPRLKALLFGEHGVGKTWASIKMPRPYIIDAEDGTAHYMDRVEKSKGAVFNTNSMEETINEVKSLMEEDHDYLTLVIDPFTSIYETELEDGIDEKGEDFGRHYGYAAKNCKRLYNLLTKLDMNVIITSHAKNEYGDGMRVLRKQPDAWKKLPYLMDVAFYLERTENMERVATVTKTRLPEFEDQSKFAWSYEALVERYGKDRLERKMTREKMADVDQVNAFNRLYSQLSDPEIKRLKIDKAISKVGVVSDFTSDQIEKGILLMKTHIGEVAA